MVKKGPDGVWRYRKRIELPDGRHIRIKGTPNTNTQSAAEAAERAHIAREETAALARMRGLPDVVLPPSVASAPTRRRVPTVREFIARFIREYAPDGRPGAIRTRNVHLNGSIATHFGGYALDEIDQSHVNAFVAAHQGSAAQTIRNKLNALSVLLGYAADLNIIEPHKLKLTVSKRKSKPATTIEALPAATIAKLIKTASKREDDHRYVVAMLLASEAGLRIGEIRALKWSDIENGKLTVRRAFDDRENLGGPKNGNERSIAISPRLKSALKKLPRKGDWVLTRLEDSDPLSYGAVCKAMKRIYRDAAVTITEDVALWHSLRHSFGTELVSAGVPLPVIQRMMDHSDIRTTMRYVSTTADQMDAAISHAFGRR
jgi:integrase